MYFTTLPSQYNAQLSITTGNLLETFMYPAVI